MGTFQTAELIETFVNYHENIKKCVCLIYDPHRSQRGALGLRAIRLKDSFISLFKQEKLSGKELREANISWKDVFVDVPVKVGQGVGAGCNGPFHAFVIVQAHVLALMHTRTYTYARTPNARTLACVYARMQSCMHVG